MKRNLKNLLNKVAKKFLSEWIYDLGGTLLGRKGENRGDCLKMVKSFQATVFYELLKELDGKIRIVRNLNHEHHYIIDILSEGKYYRITSYIIGALATNPSSRDKISTEESKYFKFLHYASLIKLQVRDGDTFSDVGKFFNEPGFGLPVALEDGDEIKMRLRDVCFKKADEAYIDEFKKQHPELAWLSQQEEDCVRDNGYVLSGVRCSDFLFIDCPASITRMRKFENEVAKCRISNVFASTKFNPDGSLAAAIQVRIPEDYKDAEINFCTTENNELKVLTLSSEQLYDALYTNRLDKDNKDALLILKVGFVLGLVEGCGGTMESEWLQRMELLSNKDTYVGHLKQQELFRASI